jgi:hypothetical protein
MTYIQNSYVLLHTYTCICSSWSCDNKLCMTSTSFWRRCSLAKIRGSSVLFAANNVLVAIKQSLDEKERTWWKRWDLAANRCERKEHIVECWIFRLKNDHLMNWAVHRWTFHQFPGISYSTQGIFVNRFACLLSLSRMVIINSTPLFL